MKAIIIYYSRSGNTEAIALRAQKDLNCEILKIVRRRHTAIISPPVCG